MMLGGTLSFLGLSTLLCGFAAVGPSGHTISPHPSSREGQHQSDRGTRPDDHVVVFGERHLREVLQSYANYYNQARTHLSLNKDAPVTRSIETDGGILAVPILGGLHRREAAANDRGLTFAAIVFVWNP
jgi:hypothetical protein